MSEDLQNDELPIVDEVLSSSSDTRSEDNEMVPGILPSNRVLPHDFDAEQAVIAAMLLEPDYCIDIVIQKLRDEFSFYSPSNREIYKAILSLKSVNKGIDIISVSSALEDEGKLSDVGGRGYLAEIQNRIATTANLEGWCEIINNLAILRSMISVCSESMAACYNVDKKRSVDLLLDELESKILKVREKTSSEILLLPDLLKDAFQNLQDILNGKKEPGLSTGFPDLDKMTSGLKPGEMFVLAARPSIGKTSLGLNVLANVALKNEKEPTPVAFFSLEMSELQIATRLLCTEAGISEKLFHNKSFNTTDFPKITRAVATLNRAKIFIDPTPQLRVLELRSKARRLHQQHGIKLIVIDYLQLMKAPGTNSRQEEVAEISGGIKSLAKELNVPILVLAQLNRDTERAGSAIPRPKLSSLRESGAIEQDADVVAFLHRDRDAQKNMTNEALESGLSAEIIIEKNRTGETGILEVLFFPQITKFVSKSHIYGDEDRPQI